jgi:hypothetical protein
MISKILLSRLVDILLIAAALYFLLPRLFRRSRKPKENERRYTVITNDKHKSSGKYADGEYIDYEEVK